MTHIDLLLLRHFRKYRYPQIFIFTMGDPPTKKGNLNLCPMDIMPLRFRSNIKFQDLGRQNRIIIQQKPAEIIQIDDLFKEAYGSSNNAWRSAVYRAR